MVRAEVRDRPAFPIDRVEPFAAMAHSDVACAMTAPATGTDGNPQVLAAGVAWDDMELREWA